MLETQVLALDRHKNVAGLNLLMGYQRDGWRKFDNLTFFML